MTYILQMKYEYYVNIIYAIIMTNTWTLHHQLSLQLFHKYILLLTKKVLRVFMLFGFKGSGLIITKYSSIFFGI